MTRCLEAERKQFFLGTKRQDSGRVKLQRGKHAVRNLFASTQTIKKKQEHALSPFRHPFLFFLTASLASRQRFHNLHESTKSTFHKYKIKIKEGKYRHRNSACYVDQCI